MNSEQEKRKPASNRREFLSGRALRSQMEHAGDEFLDELAEGSQGPAASDTVRLVTRAMACEFSVMLNPGAPREVTAASDALEIIHTLESQMTVFRPNSELSVLNRQAVDGPVSVEPGLYGLLKEAAEIARQTDRAFDPTAGQLIALWRRCRDEKRIPTTDEIDEVLTRTGVEHVKFDDRNQTVEFSRPGIELNLGGVGKGYALDRASEHLVSEEISAWLFHGGQSSILARGGHGGHDGWPVGIRNPLFPNRRYATLLLRNQAMATSGSAVQYFRYQGKRYGHILDPRSGQPVENLMSVTVLAPTAALADALSTAFFVLGVEKARQYCDNHGEVSALLFPPAGQGRTVEPVNCGIPEEVLFLTDDAKRFGSTSD